MASNSNNRKDLREKCGLSDLDFQDSREVLATTLHTKQEGLPSISCKIAKPLEISTKSPSTFKNKARKTLHFSRADPTREIFQFLTTLPLIALRNRVGRNSPSAVTLGIPRPFARRYGARTANMITAELSARVANTVLREASL